MPILHNPTNRTLSVKINGVFRDFPDNSCLDIESFDDASAIIATFPEVRMGENVNHQVPVNDVSKDFKVEPSSDDYFILPPEEAGKVGETNEQAYFRCSTCGRDFPTHQGMCIHKKRVHEKKKIA